jgi:hypothetical protein
MRGRAGLLGAAVGVVLVVGVVVAVVVVDGLVVVGVVAVCVGVVDGGAFAAISDWTMDRWAPER